MPIEAPPTVEERYTRAIHSPRLVVSARERTDVDMLIAAGWTAACFDEDGQPRPQSESDKRTRFAVALYRLASEFDSVRQEMRHVLNATEFALALMRLKTLREARESLGAYASIQATKQRFMQPDEKVMPLMGQVLSAWLDPNCHKCEGRGTIGGYGSPQVVCRGCGGTKLRLRDKQGILRIGLDGEQKRFAGHMLAEMDRLVAEVEQAMKLALRQ
jgi:ribosomal protein S27E